MTRRLTLRWIGTLAAVCFLAAPMSRAADMADSGQVLVFAAASLTEALNEVGEAYAKTGNPAPKFSYAASSALARQIESGAPANLFVSADEQWMDYLADKKLIVPATRASFLGNTLVLIAPADHPASVSVGYEFPLAKLLNGGKLSMADPDSVPAGKYGKAALENLNVWHSVESNVIRADNVRAALTFVERGEAPLGIVYGTDAALSKKVAVLGAFPEVSYPLISYPIAVVASHNTPAAEAFRNFILGPVAKAIFVKYGFLTK